MSVFSRGHTLFYQTLIIPHIPAGLFSIPEPKHEGWEEEEEGGGAG